MSARRSLWRGPGPARDTEGGAEYGTREKTDGFAETIANELGYGERISGSCDG